MDFNLPKKNSVIMETPKRFDKRKFSHALQESLNSGTDAVTKIDGHHVDAPFSCDENNQDGNYQIPRLSLGGTFQNCQSII